MRRDTERSVESTGRVRPVIDRLVREGTVTSALDGSTHDLFPVALSPGEAEGLKGWVVLEGASRTIEVGLGYGISALHICEGLLENGHPDASHTITDPNQAPRFGDCGLQALEEAGVTDMLNYYREPSELVLPRLLEKGEVFDLAFVDGNHHFEHVFVDLFYIERLVRKQGIVILDDYDADGIRRAVAFFVANHGWTIEETILDDHSVVLRTPEAVVPRHFRDLADF